MIGVENFSDEEQEPFLSQTTTIYTLLAFEDDPESLLDVLAATADNLAHSLETVVN